MSEKAKKKPYAVPAVESMLDIVEYMSEHPEAIGVTELSRQLGISTNLAFRIMKCMTDRGYTEMNPESSGYQLSTRFFSIGMLLHSRFDLRIRARKHLEWLSEKSRLTCQIQAMDGKDLLVIDSINPANDFYLRVVPGSRLYYHANSFGKAILAFLSEDEVNDILPKKLPQLTENTITSKAVLMKELNTVRETGLAYDREEYNRGIYCVGAPIFDVSGKAVAGTGVTGFASPLQEKSFKKYEKYVLQCAYRISTDIGYTGNFYDNKI